VLPGIWPIAVRAGPAAAGEIGDRRQFQRSGPRSQPPGGPQQPNQLIITQLAQPVLPRLIGERCQPRPGWQRVSLRTRREPRPPGSGTVRT
jgi:hypothetical protein